MKKDPLIFIEHIQENITDIENFSKGISKSKLVKNKLHQKAIIRCLEVIGEAVKNLPEDFTEKHSNIQWKKIAGLRDKLIHGYFGIDFNTLWDVIKSDIPLLKKDLQKIRKEMKG